MATAERMRELRKDKAKAGMTRIEVWVHKSLVQRVREAIERIIRSAK